MWEVPVIPEMWEVKLCTSLQEESIFTTQAAASTGDRLLSHLPSSLLGRCAGCSPLLPDLCGLGVIIHPPAGRLPTRKRGRPTDNVGKALPGAGGGVPRHGGSRTGCVPPKLP